MRFEVSHSFGVPPRELAEALLDPSLQPSLTDIGGLHDRTVLSRHEQADGTMIREIRCVLALEVSGVARSILGDGEPAWVQHETWNRERTHCDWVIQPEVGRDLLSASGVIDVAGSAQSSTRTVAGDVKVRVPLYGGKVERWIVDGVTRAYGDEAERVSAWLEREE
ncbi:MAG TPA: DUF2505 family protein [Actinomycetota bacterium]|nr:DUF2505 family protein [Actinomycetota bacterium]